MAFCVDIGWITKTKSELQNVADAAAAAGARQLVDNYATFNLPDQQCREKLIDDAEQQANTFSKLFGGFNGSGEVKSVSILLNDIKYGFTDANGKFNPKYSGYPNTIQVLARRDTSANRPLPLFFASVLGMHEKTLTASASATIYTGLISSFNPYGAAWGDDYSSYGDGFECLMLPVAFDVNYWNQFFAEGISPDGTIHTDGSGNSQIQIYPSPQDAPGNSGLLCIGPETNSTPDYRNWILNGPGGSDLQCLLDNGSLPVSLESPKPWKGSPGLRSTLKTEFEQIIGQPRLLPLFQPASISPYQAASGVGSNATYNIVGFVGVTVTEASGSGANLNISVQPCSVMDPTAVFDPSTVYAAGAQPSKQLKSFTHTGVSFSH